MSSRYAVLCRTLRVLTSRTPAGRGSADIQPVDDGPEPQRQGQDPGPGLPTFHQVSCWTVLQPVYYRQQRPRGFSLVLPRLSRPGDELQDLSGCGAPTSCPARPPPASAPGWAARVCLWGRSGHFQQEIVAPVTTAADSPHTSLQPWDPHRSWKLAPRSLPVARWVNGGR